jgi:uncharacterized membrane protein
MATTIPCKFAEPVFVPSVTTAIVALLLSREQAAPLAYIGGSLGRPRSAELALSTAFS